MQLDQFVHEFPVDIGEPEVAALEAIGQLLVVEAEEMEQGGVEVVHMDTVPGGVESEFIRFAEGDPRADAAAGQPNGEAIWVVIASIVAPLHHRGAAKLSAPDD